MNNKFDAYHQWLGIPPEEQPPHHYRLLGVKLLESDANVISNSADRQMAHVRTFQSGAKAAESQKLLNELAAASRCLLEAKSKKAYDTVLQSAMPADVAAAEPTKPTAPIAAPVAKAAEPREFGAYAVVERTSASPLGVIYKVQHRPTGRFFSLKTLPPDAARSVEVVKRFRREIDIVTKLDHPNLIAGVDFGEVNGVPYLVTEFVLGMDLGTLVKHQGPLPTDVAVDYLSQAARGLTQLHLNGVFHRNLKPQSLLVDMQGRLRIGNLLLAKVHEASELAKGEELTKMGEMMGTVEYQAPEQAINAAGADGRSDIYSLGCTLHFLLTGQPPYPGKSMMEKLVAHRQKPIPSLSALRSDVSPRLDQVFQRMMAKDPTQRQPFIGELSQELERLNAPAEAPKEIIDSYTLAITLGGVVLVALIAFLIWRLVT